ncbi:hypothetical protein R3P38DRAFT_2843377 [Favolaschia claudopus]|uniref:Uncharacterized protein n=1 Tax=Favolaschia claudopus TaxID=2862362 RepID=A0AAW0E3Z4_9AGAR
MGNGPSVFERSPQEHAEAAAEELERLRATVIWPPAPLQRPGCVLVQFYAYRYKVRDDLRPDMEALVPLEKSGNLSFHAVRRLWGLETCSMIERRPGHLKLGLPPDLNFLPADTVKKMVERYGCIKVIEPHASYETLIKRQIRYIALAGASFLRSYQILAVASARSDVRATSAFLQRISSKRFYITRSHYIMVDSGAVTRLSLLVLSTLVLWVVRQPIEFLLRAVLWPSVILRIIFFVSFGFLFFVAPEYYAEALGLDDEKLVIVLSA